MAFSSETAGINAVSLPTYYVKMVLIDGNPYAVAKNGTLTAPENLTQPVLDGDGLPWTVDAAREEGHTVSEIFSDVSWRTPFGANIQHPKDANTFLDSLLEAAPGVNTLRVDFNVQTLHNPQALAQFKELALAAHDRDLQLIIQYSDGEMAGRATPDNDAYPDRTDDPSGRMEEIGDEWAEAMAWFEQPENSAILDAVYGWEIVNEPMAYPNTEESGADYAQDILGVVQDHGIDWHGKYILVGGLRASAQFENVDLDTLRDALGDDLIWSMHLYPDWGHDSTISFTAEGFYDQIASRIGMLDSDNILLTETHMGRRDTNGNGVDDRFDLDADADGASAFNAARMAEFFADNGIGFTYWPPVGRQSAILLNEGRDGFDIAPSQTAFANLAWSSGEDPVEFRGNDMVVATPSADGFIRPFAQGYGHGGDDTVAGVDGAINMLYGGAGNDSVTGADGGDYVFGGHGDDTMEGNAGNDSVLGGSGDDSLVGGEGEDWLEGQTGDDHLDGGASDDTLIADGGDTLLGGEGDDHVVLSSTGDGMAWLRDYNEGDVFDLRFWEGGDVASSTLTLHDTTLTHEDGTTTNGVRVVSPNDPEFVLLVEGVDAATLSEHGAFGPTQTSVAGEGEEWAYNTDTGVWDAPDNGDGGGDPVDPEDPDGGGGDPVDPEDPDGGGGDPVDPEDPDGGGGDPVDPEDPDGGGGDPVDPEDPDGGGGDPVDPEDPDGGENPDDGDPTNPEDPDEEPRPENDNNDSWLDRTCFVATAAYGDPRHPEVVALRRWRDQVLMQSSIGRTAVACYWKVGPVAARYVAADKSSGRWARRVLGWISRRVER